MTCCAGAAVIACSSFASDGSPPTSGADARPSEDSSSSVEPQDSAADAAAPERAFRYVFITSQTHHGNFEDELDSGIVHADEFCLNSAQAGVPELHGKRWRAWLSTVGSGDEKVDARSRISRPDAGTVPYEYRLPNGTTVVLAKDYLFIPGAIPLQNLITMTERGADASTTKVWTGSNEEGKASSMNCANWSDNGILAVGAVGYANEAPRWSGVIGGLSDDRNCNLMHALYCFEVDP